MTVRPCLTPTVFSMATFLKEWVIVPAFWLAFSLTVLGPVVLRADDPKAAPKIVLPAKDGKVVMVGQTLKLSKGMRYIIQADVKCDLVIFPEGLVTIQEKTGPRDWTGIFAGGSGDYEDRAFELPFLYALAAGPSAKGTADIIVIPRGYTDQTQWKRDKVEVDGSGVSNPTDPPPKTDPPKPDPGMPPMATGKLYFMVIRPDGNATQEFYRIIMDPAWKTLESQGHAYKEFTLTKAQDIGAVSGVPNPLPCVVTLRVSPDGKNSSIVRGPTALPTTSAGILDLPKGVQ